MCRYLGYYALYAQYGQPLPHSAWPDRSPLSLFGRAQDPPFWTLFPSKVSLSCARVGGGGRGGGDEGDRGART